MAYCIAKEQSARQGKALSNRFQVKRFRHSEAMHRFLNKQHGNEWKQINQDLKSGIYFQQYDSATRGFKYINVKALM